MRKHNAMPGTQSGTITIIGVLLALAIGFPFAAALEAADSYPSKPVRFIVASSPGGSTDIIGRVIATRLSERLGKQVVAENRGGAGGSIATEQVMRAEPDGYTLLFTSAQIVQNPLLYKVEYDALKSFVPVAKMGTGPNVLTVHPSLPANSVKELIALAKKEPGKLVAASAGAGSFTHLATAHFEAMAGVNLKMVQFKGSGPAVLDAIGGHSQILFVTITAVVPHIQSGKLKALGLGASSRSKLLPDVPTISEAGVHGYGASQWFALFAPLGTPKAVVDRLHKEIAVVMNAEETKKIFGTQGVEPDLLGHAEMVKFIEAEKTKWGKVVRDGNIKGE